jgi:Xaa-Pro dipeptidase
MGSSTFGMNVVDWEQRVDLDRLRSERLGRLQAQLMSSSVGSLPSFDVHNIRYMTATHRGTWPMDKMIRFALVPQGGEPVRWDSGSVARHHQLHTPWLDYRTRDRVADGARGLSGVRAGISVLRGAFHFASGIAESVADEIYTERERYDLQNEPIGVDIIEMPVLQTLPAPVWTWWTDSRSSRRRGGPRPQTRSPCSPRRRQWSTPSARCQ